MNRALAWLRRTIEPRSPAPARAPVSGLWIGKPLTAMQRCSIQSFLDAGHPYRLYSYGPLEGVPAGAELVDGNRILPAARIWRYRDHDSPSGFSNQFRYRLLQEHGGTWADLDLICLRPLPDTPYLLPQQAHESSRVGTCLLRAPAGCELLARAIAEAEAVDTKTVGWGVIGPDLITRLARQLELPLLPIDAVCAVGFADWRQLVSADPEVQARVRAAVAPSFAVHLWHEMWRSSGADPEGPWPAGCLYEELKARFLRPA